MIGSQRGQAEAQAAVGLISFIIVIVLTGILGGAFRMEVSYSISAPNDSGHTFPFEENISATHWLGGLVKGAPINLNEALAKYMRTGEQITRLTIVTKHTLVDVLLLGVTFGIYAPMTVTVRGEVRRVDTGAADDGAPETAREHTDQMATASSPGKRPVSLATAGRRTARVKQ